MTEQTRLDVGETRKPAAIKDKKRVTTGDLAALAMCAHLYEPGDVAGWYTHEPEDVIRQWITSNVSSVIARLSPHCEYSRGELPPLHPADDVWVGEVDTGPEQTKLVTDGGQSVDGTVHQRECYNCDGMGRLPFSELLCEICNGSGYRSIDTDTEYGGEPGA